MCGVLAVDDQAVRKIVDRIVADGYSRTYSYILVDGRLLTVL